MRCPNNETLRWLLDGTLTLDEARGWSQHIADCAECQSSLARLSDDDELRAWRDARSAVASSPHDDAACESLVGRALAELRLAPRAEQETARGNVVDGGGRRSSLVDDFPLPLDPPSHPHELGRLGHYRVECEIGRGGMGVVVRAFDERLQRTVALKLLRPPLADAAGRARFVREAQSAARVRHPYVVAVHQVENSPATPPYLVMEYVSGASLRERIVSSRRVDPRQAAEWIAQAADGLAAAHAEQLVHRDIKPANILLAPIDDGSFVAKLTDFGLARALDADPTHASVPAQMTLVADTEA